MRGENRSSMKILLSYFFKKYLEEINTWWPILVI